jgi:hypothetical protein
MRGRELTRVPFPAYLGFQIRRTPGFRIVGFAGRRLPSQDEPRAIFRVLICGVMRVIFPRKDRRGFQSFQVALAGRRLRKKMFGNLKCRHGLAAVDRTSRSTSSRARHKMAIVKGSWLMSRIYSPCP